MKAIGAFLVLMFSMLSGCSTVNVEQPQYSEKVGRTPEIGAQSSAPVGGLVYQQYRYSSTTGYTLSDSVNIGFKLGRIRASAGENLTKVTIDGKVAYCTEKRTYFDPLIGPLSVSCFIDSKQDGTFNRVTSSPGAVWLESEIPISIKYSKTEQFLNSQDPFKYELLYEGVSNKSLRLVYREYINELARPAFFQDVNYDIASLPMTITFRSVRVQVISANNEAIVFRVLSGF